MIVAIFASRVLGWVRAAVIAHQFGANQLSDAYYAAFTVPDLLYFLLAGGALSSAFIPVFTSYLAKGEKEEAWHVFSSIATIMSAVLVVIILVAELFAPQLVRAIAPGFTASQTETTAFLSRIMLPAQLFFFLGGLLMGTLYAQQHFLTPALGPIIYNCGIILGAVTLASALGVAGPAWGVLGGAFIGSFLLQLVVAWKKGMVFRPSFDVRHPGVVKVFKLMLPVILGLSLPQVDVIINRAFASLLVAGSVTWLDYANRLMQMPLGIFGQASSVALFPTLAEQAAKEMMDEFRTAMNLGIRVILFLTIPASALMMVLAVPFTQIAFQRGQFAASDTRQTAYALIFYSIGVFAHSGASLINRGFYALHDTVTPVVVGTVMTALFVGLNYLLIQPRFHLAHGGLALATSLVAVLNMLVMLVILRRRIGGLNGYLILSSFLKVMLATLLLSAGSWAARDILASRLNTSHLSGAALQFTLAGGFGLLLYTGAVILLKVEEVQFVWSMVRRKTGKRG
ncbi:MAG: murein biosynthesis integral membrane protein MurJ [Armatimonadetes bacterium]|nr:murein biosynthesis integral membrane protein MurJ [Armatimonadota bacterium]